MTQQTTAISVHSLVLDLRPHRPVVYWTDFGASIFLFWACVVFASYTPQLAYAALAVVPASFALYRAALFAHEVGHFGRQGVRWFAVAWNVLCGIPIGMPSFMLKSHVDHHGTGSYGTANDPEYLPFAAYPKARQWFFWGSLLVPGMFMLRAMVLVPLAWVHARTRTWLRLRMSYMTMNNAYQPSSDFQRLTRADLAVEAATAVWCYGLLALLFLGWLPWRFAIVLFVCMMAANMLNAWRTLRAHKYTSVGQPMDAAGQLKDSTTFTLPVVWGELMCPVGQRFHAAHHMFPYLPYHALAEAHRRVLASDWAGLDDYKLTMV
jgi:fatty acid desaturase